MGVDGNKEYNFPINIIDSRSCVFADEYTHAQHVETGNYNNATDFEHVKFNRLGTTIW
jgi:hypothetical protein